MLRRELPVLAVLAVLAVPPSLALGDDVAGPATDTAAVPAASADAAPAAADPSAAPPAGAEAPPATVPPVVPPATTAPAWPTTAPALPTPTTTTDAAPGTAPGIRSPSAGGSGSAPTAAERRRARRERARAAAARKRARKAAAEKQAKDAKADGEKDGDAKPGDDPLGAPVTGISALSVAKFRIPPFLLPIYQAAGVQYGIRWEILAAINEIETDYGRNLNVSTAGALGWMQFMPPTWASYGVDANGDGDQDPYNPVDAIFAAARYLRAAGGDKDVERAVFAYNHAGWYVDDVMARAKAIAALPADVVSSLTGLTLAQVPVHSPGPKGRDDLGVRVRATKDRDWAAIAAPDDAAVVAVQDATVTRIGTNDALGRFVELRDAYGNRYTYAHLGALAEDHVVPKRRAKADDDHDAEESDHAEDDEAAADRAKGGGEADDGARAAGGQAADDLTVPAGGAPTTTDPAPTAPATAGRRVERGEAGTKRAVTGKAKRSAAASSGAGSGNAKGRAAASSGAGDAPRTGGLGGPSVGPSRPATVADEAGPTTARRSAPTGADPSLAGTIPALPAPATTGPVPAPAAVPPAASPTTPATTPTTPATTSTTPATATPGNPAAGPASPAAEAPGEAAPVGTNSVLAPAPAGTNTVLPPAPAATTGPLTAAVQGIPATGGPLGPTVPGTATGGPLAPTVPDTTTGGQLAPAVPGTTTTTTGAGVPLPSPEARPADAATTPAPAPAGPTTLTPDGSDGVLGVAVLRTVAALSEQVRVAAQPVPEEPAAEEDADAEPSDRVDRLDRYIVRSGGLRRADVRRRPLKVGSRVLAGSVLGRAGSSAMRFAIRPAGRGAPRIDPRPIVAGWRLLDDARVFSDDDRGELVADAAEKPGVGRLLLMSKEQLQARVLANERLTIYPAGREDIRTGQIDRRVLATMEYLVANGHRLTITSLKTGHSILSASGNVSAHSYGSAVDIAAVDGIPIMGHQGAGSITDRTNRLLLRLQGTMKPNQIISLMTYPGTDNTLAMGDHDDHIHVGFPRDPGAGGGNARLGAQVAAVLKPAQWDQLVSRLAEIDNPTVRRGVSEAATPARKKDRGRGED